MLTRSSAFPEMLTKCRLMKSIRLLPTLSGMFFLKRNCRHRIVCNNYVVFSTSGFKLKQQEISTSFWWLPFRRRYRSSFKLIRSTNRLPIHPSSTLRNVVEHTPGVTEDGMADSASPESPGLTPQALLRDSSGTLTRPAGIDGLRLPGIRVLRSARLLRLAAMVRNLNCRSDVTAVAALFRFISRPA